MLRRLRFMFGIRMKSKEKVGTELSVEKAAYYSGFSNIIKC